MIHYVSQPVKSVKYATPCAAKKNKRYATYIYFMKIQKESPPINASPSLNARSLPAASKPFLPS